MKLGLGEQEVCNVQAQVWIVDRPKVWVYMSEYLCISILWVGIVVFLCDKMIFITAEKWVHWKAARTKTVCWGNWCVGVGVCVGVKVCQNILKGLADIISTQEL